jgi:hypothetical protein
MDDLTSWLQQWIVWLHAEHNNMASTTSFAAIIIGLLTTYCYRVPSVLAIPDRKGEYITLFFFTPISPLCVHWRSELFTLWQYGAKRVWRAVTFDFWMKTTVVHLLSNVFGNGQMWGRGEVKRRNIMNESYVRWWLGDNLTFGPGLPHECTCLLVWQRSDFWLLIPTANHNLFLLRVRDVVFEKR